MLSDHTKKRVTILFHWQDWGKDGRIDESDYRIALARHANSLNIERNSKEYTGLLMALQNDWNQLREHADLTGSGDVSLEEFLAYHDSMFSAHKNATTVIAQKILEGIDSDRDGRVTKQEWYDYLEMLGIDNSEIDKIFAKNDPRGEGFLTLQEIIVALDAWYLNEDPEHPGHWLFGDPDKLEAALPV